MKLLNKIFVDKELKDIKERIVKMDKETLYIGSHVSMSAPDYYLGSVKEALSYGANTLMFYTGTPQNTFRLPLERLKIDEGHMIYKFWNREEKEYQTLIMDGNARFAPGERDSLVIGMTAWRCFEDGKYWWGDGKLFGNFDLVILDEASQLRLDLGIWAR